MWMHEPVSLNQSEIRRDRDGKYNKYFCLVSVQENFLDLQQLMSSVLISLWTRVRSSEGNNKCNMVEYIMIRDDRTEQERVTVKE